MLDSNKNRYELIEQYLEGNMSAKNTIAFEKLIVEDKDLAKEIELHQQLSAHYNDNYISLKRDLNNTDLVSYFRSDEAKNINKTIEKVGAIHTSKKKFKFPMTVAASIIGVMICVVGYLQLNKNGLYEGYYTENDLPSLISRNTTKDLQSDIIVAYQKKQYTVANNLYRSYINSTPILNEDIFIYGGMTYLELNEFDKALIEFHKMTNSSSMASSKGLWFTALVYLKKEDYPLLKETLNIIVQKKSNFNYKKAGTLLQELD